MLYLFFPGEAAAHLTLKGAGEDCLVRARNVAGNLTGRMLVCRAAAISGLPLFRMLRLETLVGLLHLWVLLVSYLIFIIGPPTS